MQDARTPGPGLTRTLSNPSRALGLRELPSGLENGDAPWAEKEAEMAAWQARGQRAGGAGARRKCPV